MSTHAVLQQSAFLVWMLIAMMIPPLWRWRVREDWWWLHHWPTIIIALAGHLVASHNTTGWPEIIITLLASIRPMGSGQVTWSPTTYGLSDWVNHGERTEGCPESIKDAVLNLSFTQKVQNQTKYCCKSKVNILFFYSWNGASFTFASYKCRLIALLVLHMKIN